MEHRLAAILAADMVGYSRLIKADEAGKVLQLKTVNGGIRLGGGAFIVPGPRPDSTPA